MYLSFAAHDFRVEGACLACLRARSVAVLAPEAHLTGLACGLGLASSENAVFNLKFRRRSSRLEDLGCKRLLFGLEIQF